MPRRAKNDEQRGELTATVWLFLLKAGGRWASGDVTKGTGLNGVDVCWTLAAMVRNGTARKFDEPGLRRRFRYGVTGACKVPRGVSLQQVAECVLAEAPDREEQPA